MTEPRDDMPEWLERYVDAGRDVPDVSEDARARMLARLVAATGGAGGMGGADGGDAGSGAVAGSAATGSGGGGSVIAGSKLALVVTAMIGLGVGGVIGAASHAALTRPVVIERRVEVPVPRDVVEDPPPSSARPRAMPAPAAATEDGSVTPTPAPSTHATRTSSPDAGARSAGDPSAIRADTVGGDAGPTRSRDVALADENALITRAQSALARGRAGEALEAVREHERDFPRGRFVEEREVLAIQALARSGRAEQASARAERFYRRYPSSMLTRVVRAAVGAP